MILQVYSAILLYFNKRHGLRTSGLVFLFWFFLVIFGIPQMRSEARRHQEGVLDASLPVANWDRYNFISFTIFFGLSCVLLVLNCFADQEPQETKYPKSRVGLDDIFVFTFFNNINRIVNRIHVRSLDQVFCPKCSLLGSTSWR